jgi:predicted O-methyltransferase YrrM
MNSNSSEFKILLERATHDAQDYVTYSPSQIEKGEHLLNDPKIGERAWSIPESTGKFLYSLILKTGSTSGLELGTSVGYSTLWITAGLTENDPHAQLITIEKNNVKSKIAQENLLSKFEKNITFHTGRIIDILPELNQSFDIIFMDADRGNYQEYWKYIFPLLNKKSIVVIDNASRVQKSVQEFQEMLKNDTTLITYLHDLDNGLFLVTLKDSEHSLSDIMQQ